MTPGSRLITVEPDPRLAAAARTVLSGLPAVHVRQGDWRALADVAPYDLLFLDGGDSKWAIDECAAYLAPGGIAVIGDMSPEPNWPEPFDDPEQGYRWAWAAGPDIASVEVISGPATSPGYPPFVALLAVERTSRRARSRSARLPPGRVALHLAGVGRGAQPAAGPVVGDRAQAALGPGTGQLDVVPAPAQLRDHVR